MTEIIEVSGQTYKRLIQKMVRFEDTPDTVIARLLDESVSRATEPRSPESGPIANGVEGPTEPQPGGEDPAVDFSFHDIFEPPADLLKHTTVRRAEVDGREIVGANWTRVRQSMVTIALDQRGYDLHRLLEFCPMNAVEEVKTDEGYTHYSELGVSIQGQDATRAWRAAAAVARELELSVKVWFQWQANPKAKHPGQQGIISSIVRTSAHGVEGPTGPRPGGEEPAVDFSFHDVLEPPSDLLKHTRVLRAEVDSREIVGANWTRVRQSMVTIALDQLGYDLHQLLEFCPMNAVEGVNTDEGYTHCPELGVSIQGQDATRAWRAAAAVARKLGRSVKVWFQWRANPRAKHPGKRGIVTIGQELAPQ